METINPLKDLVQKLNTVVTSPEIIAEYLIECEHFTLTRATVVVGMYSPNFTLLKMEALFDYLISQGYT